MYRTEDIRVLLRKISNSDEEALGKLIDVYAPKLMAFCAKFTNDKIISEELVQDAFVTLWKKKSMLSEIDNFDAYLFRMARNLCLDYLNKLSKERKLKEALSFQQNGYYNSMEDFLVTKQYEQQLKTILDSLPKRQKEIFEMSRIQGKSHKEIAQILQISHKTVDEHISRVLKKIKSQLFVDASAVSIANFFIFFDFFLF